MTGKLLIPDLAYTFSYCLNPPNNLNRWQIIKYL